MERHDLIDEYRAAVADWTRQFDVWAATQPGTADANGEEERLHRCLRRAIAAEDKLLAALENGR